MVEGLSWEGAPDISLMAPVADRELEEWKDGWMILVLFGGKRQPLVDRDKGTPSPRKLRGSALKRATPRTRQALRGGLRTQGALRIEVAFVLEDIVGHRIRRSDTAGQRFGLRISRRSCLHHNR